jgi:DUF1680 family protein
MLKNEFGGINEAFYNLYAITGNQEHKALAEFFCHAEVIDPLAEHRDELHGKHANTFIPKIIGESRNYELTSDERSRSVAKYFWNEVIRHQTYCTGGNSHKEKFIPPGKISENLTGYTQETCNTYNMLKLTRHLFCWEAEAKYADYYERALYNHVLGQQDPASGMVAYFLPLLPGAHKMYSTPENSFWCCVGTGFESHAKYGEAIYYHSDNELFVNLFIPSVLNWGRKNLTVTQTTGFPESGLVNLSVSTGKPQQLTIKLRYPSWTSNVEVKVNGKQTNVKQTPSNYISIDRIWKNGDKIEVNYPMRLQIAEANDNLDKAAVTYGPLVLAGVMGTEGMVAPAPFSNPELYNDYYTYEYNIPAGIKTSLQIDKKNLSKNIKPVAGEKPAFIAEKENVRLEPVYKIHGQRYVIYWDINCK